jgi:DNA-binding response OmpR family regulator
MPSRRLVHELGGSRYDDVQILRTWMSRLRYKIEKNPNEPSLIKTISKTGYIIDQPPADDQPSA